MYYKKGVLAPLSKLNEDSSVIGNTSQDHFLVTPPPIVTKEEKRKQKIINSNCSQVKQPSFCLSNPSFILETPLSNGRKTFYEKRNGLKTQLNGYHSSSKKQNLFLNKKREVLWTFSLL